MKCKISKEEIEKMLKDQLKVTEIKWDKNGSAEVEIDMDKVNKKETVVIRDSPTYVIQTPYKYPIYWYSTTTSGNEIKQLKYTVHAGGDLK